MLLLTSVLAGCAASTAELPVSSTETPPTEMPTAATSGDSGTSTAPTTEPPLDKVLRRGVFLSGGWANEDRRGPDGAHEISTSDAYGYLDDALTPDQQFAPGVAGIAKVVGWSFIDAGPEADPRYDFSRIREACDLAADHGGQMLLIVKMGGGEMPGWWFDGRDNTWLVESFAVGGTERGHKVLPPRDPGDTVLDAWRTLSVALGDAFDTDPCLGAVYVSGAAVLYPEMHVGEPSPAWQDYYEDTTTREQQRAYANQWIGATELTGDAFLHTPVVAMLDTVRIHYGWRTEVDTNGTETRVPIVKQGDHPGPLMRVMDQLAERSLLEGNLRRLAIGTANLNIAAVRSGSVKPKYELVSGAMAFGTLIDGWPLRVPVAVWGDYPSITNGEEARDESIHFWFDESPEVSSFPSTTFFAKTYRIHEIGPRQAATAEFPAAPENITDIISECSAGGLFGGPLGCDGLVVHRRSVEGVGEPDAGLAQAPLSSIVAAAAGAF